MAGARYRRDAIVRADAADLLEYARPGSVALTVTSPPYRNAIDYARHVSNMDGGGDEWVRGAGADTTEGYLGKMERVFGRVFDATREGGFCCIVVGDEVVSGKLVPLPSLLLSRLAGTETADDPGRWRLRDVIVWHKVTSGRNGSGNRFGLFVQFPYPGYFRANIMHEYILVLQKGAARPGRRAGGRGRIPVNRIVKREIANSVWNIPPVPPGVTDHPVPFPEQIPWRLITLLTRRGDTVLDPMNGSGQTTKVARALGRRYLGLDIEQRYVDEARRRLGEGLKLGSYLIPVFHREAWSGADQGGFFETDEADLSADMPRGYRPLFESRHGGGARGADAYAYYGDGSGYMCMVLGAAGRIYRLNLGSPADRGSLLRRAESLVPAGGITRARLGRAMGGRIVEGRHAANACLDVLERLGRVGTDGGLARRRAGRRPRRRSGASAPRRA